MGGAAMNGRGGNYHGKGTRRMKKAAAAGPSRGKYRALTGICVALLLFPIAFGGRAKHTLRSAYPSPGGARTVELYGTRAEAGDPWRLRDYVKGRGVLGKRAIYLENREARAEVRWLDEETIVINGSELNVFHDLVRVYHNEPAEYTILPRSAIDSIFTPETT